MGEPEIVLAQVLVTQESWDKTKAFIAQESLTKACQILQSHFNNTILLFFQYQ